VEEVLLKQRRERSRSAASDRSIGDDMEDRNEREYLRLKARLEAFQDLKAEIEPWLMEERDASAREAMANVLLHLDAEIAEQRRRLDVLGQAGRQ
jgi:hypothetical protein